MTTTTTTLKHPDPYQDQYNKTLFGFWCYIMTDCVLFSCLFAAWAVLHDNSFGGATSQQIFGLPNALAETLALLTSSFLCGIGMWHLFRNNKRGVLISFIFTFLLGLTFVVLELNEFVHFVQAGNDWSQSAFLTSFFSLVGTHGLHVSFGLLWMAFMIVQLIQRGIVPDTIRRFACLSLFWHFLDVIWIFIFTFVYLVGVL